MERDKLFWGEGKNRTLRMERGRDGERESEQEKCHSTPKAEIKIEPLHVFLFDIFA